ncbi:Gfo/Idh/MocA family protein [Streptomyces acidiscabies]|uniref:Gfo/Idh/MocA family oxidoreductase n=3 Tax=Streptomyces acidiscabies TaxID=42234 RepID=A0AAP6EIS9_9ACTN|nr:Gfo/Idh/MocA family oxidoreductase [Streptomyces acidiscabies]MBP5942318.1 Gfo/Idh/MocA family oxidoreductase [Streptomyces sp. LBUM 1476]MBZ3913875.1 Gfo/Idh/MocA family oxidoreductase [Streptomyces acidiscabies]MDX2964502.1 Gfo/Idh/MocA family oxidoreductase [Streptomyces acidiscabies]MDX3022034.1 Gfo/Idh/MocA family oxidoreductase [Streptomyces acidiscabies]MDX3793598.1 Gfo/Idh/MocA family oxidoreductase [Streptomyces acidiscabies]
MLTFGVIGCGSIGGFWTRLLTREDTALAPRARLAAVAGRDPVRAGALAAEAGCGVTTVPGLLARPDVDAVLLCTPSGTHAELAEEALRAGKHVLVEKPVDVTPEAADRLIGVARETGRTLGVVSQHRFDPAAKLAHEAIRSGGLGRVTSVMTELSWWRAPAYYASGTWRGTPDLDGGGALMNQAIHAVDLVQWLAGPVVEVTAHTAQLAHPGIAVEDVATASLRFADGALGTLLATTAAYPGRTARTAVNGDRGSVVIDDDELAYLHLSRDGEEAPAYGAFGAADQSDAHRTELARDEARDATGMLYQPHRDQLLDFCDAVRDNRPPLSDGEDGRRAVAVVTAIYTSARTGRPQQVHR